jgi:hypothetical protein
MDVREVGWGSSVYPAGSGQGLVADCCECGDEPSGTDATELVYLFAFLFFLFFACFVPFPDAAD